MMIQLVKNIINLLFSSKRISLVKERDFLQQRLILGQLLAQQQILLPIKKLQDAEFKVFSQWHDDGIIQYLVRHLPQIPKTFIEFGVENYTEANTRFLLENNNWCGLIFDGSEENINYIRKQEYYFMHDITAQALFITAENINENIEKNGFGGEIGILHIDIDGNDYWVWKAITIVNPVVVIIEYNSVFGAERCIAVPYQADFQRTKAHHTGLYFGASLAAFVELGKSKGYAFIGSNSHANNAYFVRKDQLQNLTIPEMTAKEGYKQNKFREHRNLQGQLTFTPPFVAQQDIKGLPVYNILTDKIESF
jgi:hypothetical protein